MHRIIRFSAVAAAAFAALVCTSQPAAAQTVTFTRTDVGGGSFEYNATLNNPLAAPVGTIGTLVFAHNLTADGDSLVIFADAAPFPNTSGGGPAGWSYQSLTPAALFFGAGGGGGTLAPGASLSGFTFRSTMFVSAFEFGVLGTAFRAPAFEGIATLAPASIVPEPASALLFIPALSALRFLKRRKEQGA